MYPYLSIETTWRHLTLKNGLAVQIRPIQHTDAPYFIDVFEHLSSESRASRFNRSMENLSQRQKITEALKIAHDGVEHGQGWLAFAELPDEGNVAVGGIRYYRVSAESGELAITIRDDLHGLGLGHQLLQHLIVEARQAGLRTITGLTQHNNSGMWALLKRTQLPLKRTNDGPDSYFELTL